MVAAAGKESWGREMNVNVKAKKKGGGVKVNVNSENKYSECYLFVFFAQTKSPCLSLTIALFLNSASSKTGGPKYFTCLDES